MRTKLSILLAAGLLLQGCSSITDPGRLEDFEWGEVEDASTIVEGIDPAVGLGDLFILGQVSTPHRCYRLEGTFSRNGQTLTLRVRGNVANPDCADTEGGYRYTATIRHLEGGTYDLNVIHQVEGRSTTSYTETVDL